MSDVSVLSWRAIFLVYVLGIFVFAAIFYVGNYRRNRNHPDVRSGVADLESRGVTNVPAVICLIVGVLWPLMVAAQIANVVGIRPKDPK